MNLLFIFYQTVLIKRSLIFCIISISCNAVLSSVSSTSCMDMHSWRISSKPFRMTKGGCLNRPWWWLASESEKIFWHITCNTLETPSNYFLTPTQIKFEILDVEENKCYPHRGFYKHLTKLLTTRELIIKHLQICVD